MMHPNFWDSDTWKKMCLKMYKIWYAFLQVLFYFSICLIRMLIPWGQHFCLFCSMMYLWNKMSLAYSRCSEKYLLNEQTNSNIILANIYWAFVSGTIQSSLLAVTLLIVLIFYQNGNLLKLATTQRVIFFNTYPKPAHKIKQMKEEKECLIAP